MNRLSDQKLIDAVKPLNEEVNNDIFTVSRQIDSRTSYTEKLFMLYFLMITTVFVIISCLGEIFLRGTLLNDDELAKDRAFVHGLNDHIFTLSMVLLGIIVTMLLLVVMAIYYAPRLYRYNELQNDVEFEDIEDIGPFTYAMEGSRVVNNSLTTMNNIERNLNKYEQEKELDKIRRRRFKTNRTK